MPFFTGFGGFMFVYALTLQDGARFSALRTGITLLPMAIGFLVASLSMPRLVARFGRRVIAAGAIAEAAGMVGLAALLWTDWPQLAFGTSAPVALVIGIGQGLIMVPLFRAVLSDVPPRQAGIGSGVLTTTQQTSLALGVATLGSLYLTESSPVGLGPQGAAIVVVGILVVVAVVVGFMSRKLPD